MEKESFNHNGIGEQNQGPSDILRLAFLFLRNWYWLALGLAITLSLTWLRLRYSTSIFSVQGTMLINTAQQSRLSEEALVQELGYEGSRADADDETQILRSSSLMRQVVDSLDIHISYFLEGRVKDSEQYKPSYIRLTQAEPMEQAYWRTLRLRIIDQDDFMLLRSEKDTVSCRFGVPFVLDNVTFTVDHDGDIELTPGNIFRIQIADPEAVARGYAGKLNAQQVGFSNVISLSMNDPVPAKAVDVINVLIAEYNGDELDEKSEAGTKTLAFIDKRLEFITEELYGVEKDVESFRRTRDLPVEIDSRAQDYLSRAGEADNQLVDLELRMLMLNNIEQEIRDKSNPYKTLPLGSEILSGVLDGLIEKYNELIYQRDKILKTATLDNPAADRYNEQLNYLKGNILQSIRAMRQELQTRKKTLEDRLKPLERQISQVPRNQRELLQIMRQQQIKESLFLFLLQKREETELSIAAQTTNSRILDPPTVGGRVSPDPRRMYMLAFLLGLAIPAGSIYLLDIL
ncbi:MAG: GumC family protein, partial [Saprospiraceae bacterium]